MVRGLAPFLDELLTPLIPDGIPSLDKFFAKALQSASAETRKMQRKIAVKGNPSLLSYETGGTRSEFLTVRQQGVPATKTKGLPFESPVRWRSSSRTAEVKVRESLEPLDDSYERVSENMRNINVQLFSRLFLTLTLS